MKVLEFILEFIAKPQLSIWCGISKKTNRSMEQNRGSRSRPHMCGQPITDKGVRAVQWRKNNLSTNGAETGIICKY